MLPAIPDGTRVVVDVLAYRGRIPERFDVVLTRPPKRGRREDIKRIIGLPGELITLEAERLEVNGCEVVQPFEFDIDPRRFQCQVPSDSVLIVGDNRSISIDSRSYGPLKLERITGKVVRKHKP